MAVCLLVKQRLEELGLEQKDLKSPRSPEKIARACGEKKNRGRRRSDAAPSESGSSPM